MSLFSRSPRLCALALPACLTLLAGCAGEENASSSDTATAANTEPGQLTVVANGEDFVRQGFTSKDGWRIDFDRVEVTLGEIVPKSEAGDPVEPIAPQSVDLAAGDENAEPIELTTVTVPSGYYSGVEWSIASADDAPSIVMTGTAKKDDREMAFELAFAPNLAYSCGEYVGDERKGFVEPDAPGELEITFHFDHIFGDAGAPADDKINVGGFGFDRFAALEKDGKVVVTPETMSEQFSVDEISQIAAPIAGLGHVGEGHCEAAAQ
ncbi:MAG: DUF4382 domain-containing protein [Geitlerinemataceae cyanobacterium]